MVVTGKGVDLHLGYGRAVREVMERMALSRLGVEVNPGRAVVALREERNPVAVSALDYLCEGGAGHRGGDRREACTQLAAGVRDGGAIEVGTGGGGGRGCVRHLVGAGRHDAD